ncbi:MAG: hypothetical protein ACLPT4_15050 [Verrucomicrobiia bacterium]
MNEIAVSVSRQFDPPRLRLPVLRGNRRSILLCGLCAGAVLLAVPTGRNADQVPAPAPARVVRALGAPDGDGSPFSPSEITREAAARSAMMRSKTDSAGVRNRFEPETAGDGRRQVAVVCDPVRRGFDGPMWRFLLNEPVRPDIDLAHNQTYFGVTVTLPFGG